MTGFPQGRKCVGRGGRIDLKTPVGLTITVRHLIKHRVLITPQTLHPPGWGPTWSCPTRLDTGYGGHAKRHRVAALQGV